MKKKGFTLLELLAVIIIMVIILLIFAPDVLNIINKSETKTYLVKESLVERAGEDYVLLNNIDLPSGVGQEKLINIQTLVQNNLVTEIYDLSNKESECLGYVVVKKNSTYGHSYNTCLFCESYQTENIDCHIDRMDTIDLQIPVILMYGTSPTYVELGSVYNDQGGIALDTDTKNITDRMVITGLPINTNSIGINTVTYDVTNIGGISAYSVTREVVVRDTVAPAIVFGTDGNLTPSKTHSSTVTATDISGLYETKYLWSTSPTAPSDILFTESFTSGNAVNSPTSLNGTYYLWVYARDNNNNISKVRSNAFVFDNIHPSIATATIVSNNTLNNKYAKNGNTLTLSITFSEAVSNTPTVTIGGRSASVSGSETSRTATYTIPADESTLSEGNISINISNYTDEAGNIGSSSSTITSGGTVNYDRTPPVYTYFYIGGSGNPSYINTVNTVLSTSVNGASDLCVNTSSTSCNAWETYSATRSVTLSSGDGLKTLYMWFRDQAGNTIGPYSDSITLDATDPTVTSTTITSNNALSNKQAKNGDTLTLNITFSETISNTPTVTIGGRNASVSGSGTTRTATYTIPGGEVTLAEGNISINISNYSDEAGNTGSSTSTITTGGTVNYNRTPPQITHFYIGGSGNPAYVTSTSTSLYSDVSSDTTQMCISTTTSCSAWGSYLSSASYTLSAGEGTKTLYAWYRDAAGNVSNMVSDAVIYDVAAPTVTAATIVSNNALNNKQAKNGDTLTLSITFSETISNTPTVTIGGRSASVSGSGTTRTATYAIPVGEATLTEGNLSINISNYNDSSGRTGSASSTITSGGAVNYDRTAPVVTYFYIGGTGNPSYITNLSTTLYSNVNSDATEMCVGSGCTSWETYATTKAYTFTGSYGATLTQYNKYRDQAGNETTQSSDSTLYLQAAHSDVYTCGVSGYSSDEMGWSTSTSTVIQGSATYTNYVGPMYFGASTFGNIRTKNANYDITSVEVRILSHVGYARTVRLYVGGPCPTPDYATNGISGSNPTPIGGSSNYVETSVAANSWAVFTITNSTWINALLNGSSACLYINRGDSSGSYWEGDGAKDTNKPTLRVYWTPNP